MKTIPIPYSDAQGNGAILLKAVYSQGSLESRQSIVYNEPSELSGSHVGEVGEGVV